MNTIFDCFIVCLLVVFWGFLGVFLWGGGVVRGFWGLLGIFLQGGGGGGGCGLRHKTKNFTAKDIRMEEHALVHTQYIHRLLTTLKDLKKKKITVHVLQHEHRHGCKQADLGASRQIWVQAGRQTWVQTDMGASRQI